jgi:hypothetical protein
MEELLAAAADMGGLRMFVSVNKPLISGKG